MTVEFTQSNRRAVKRSPNHFSIGVLAGLSFVVLVAAQETGKQNPLSGKPEAIKEGASLFRSNCSPCHGLRAGGGGRGPDLTSGRWTHGSTDADIFRTITQGVPGTQMPANGIEESETWAIIAYLRSLSPAPQAVLQGNVQRGEAMFRGTAGCATCHMVNGKGGLLGPDLSRVGASRSRQYLVESIRTPDTELSDGMSDPNNHYVSPLIYDTVTITLVSGEQITGVAKDEDTFSIQLMDTNQKLRLYEKSEVKSVQHENKSLMPSYDETTIPPAALEDILAYLESLRGM